MASQPPTLPKQPVGIPALLRKLNTTHVLRAIRGGGASTRALVAKTTGLSQPTVNQIVTELIKAGLIIEESGPASQPARRGRPGTFLSFNSGAGHVLGIDIGAEKVSAMVADLEGKILSRESDRSGTPDQLRPKPLLKLIHSVVSKALQAAKVNRRELMAVGVGVPGSIDAATGRIKFVPALPDWEGIHVAKQFERGLNCPVLVSNDMHLAILAERRFGAARGVAHAVYLHIGVGIGLGILINGEIYTGGDGDAGEIAFLPIVGDADRPAAGFGRFEWVAGSTALARHGRRIAAIPDQGRMLRDLAGGGAEAVDAKVVLEAAAQSDPAARRIVDDVVGRLCTGISAINCVLNPSVIILGGELVNTGDAFIAPLRRQLVDLEPRPVNQVTVSSLGADVVVLGAVQRALRFVDERLSDGGFSTR
jgi:predicted NBD/HSP70 family sugar kinase